MSLGARTAFVSLLGALAAAPVAVCLQGDARGEADAPTPDDAGAAVDGDLDVADAGAALLDARDLPYDAFVLPDVERGIPIDLPR